MTMQRTKLSFPRMRLSALACLGMFASHEVAAQVRQTPADTGRMAWGHHDYTAYINPALCDRAVAEISADMRRTYIPDTVAEEQVGAPIARVIPEPVLAAARTCAGRFTVDAVEPRDLWSMTRLALVLGDDAQARAAIDRRLQFDTTPAQRAIDLSVAITILVGGSIAMPRIDMAREYLKELDAITDAKIEQFNARRVILNYWIRIYNADSIRVYATHMIELGRELTLEERNNVMITAPYEALIDLANEAGDLDLQQKLLDEAELDEVGAWQVGGGEQWVARTSGLLSTRRSVYGKKTRPLAGTHWFNHQNTPRPVPGKVSLLVRVSHTCGVRCHALYRMIKELHEQYGEQLDITLIAATRGFSPGTGPLAPAEEVQSISEYFLNFLNMPTALLVEETPMAKIADGRVVAGRSEISAMFANWNGANAILVDKEGRIQWFGDISYKRMFDAALARTLNAPPSP